MSAAALLLTMAAAQAQPYVPFIPSDPRIRAVPFNAGQVVGVAVDPGYATVISFGPEERVESIVVGDSAGWQVTASKRGDDIVVKSLAGAVTTNMVVTTEDRHFVFQLHLASGGSPYMLQFTYPDTTPARAVAIAPMTVFKFSGERALFPAFMSDDGARTTIHWSPSTALPAVFAVEKDGREAIVNGRMVDGSLVVERIASRFVFRLGKAYATASRRVRRSR